MKRNKYLALLRGVNVGGNAKLPMAELKTALLHAGFDDVSTYIQSGNIIFSSTSTDTIELAQQLQGIVKKSFALDIGVAVLSKSQWVDIIKSAPKWWGNDPSMKHNILVLLPPYDMKQTIAAIGTLKPSIERIESGKGVVYQSLSLELFGRTTSGKIASNPIYKKMTVRNYNTATKLLALLTA